MSRPLLFLCAVVGAAIILLPHFQHQRQAVMSAEPAKTERKKPPQFRSGQKEVEKALAKPASLDFVETPLQDVVDFLSEKHKINIVIDQKALEDVGIETNTPITKCLRSVSLRSVLDLMLRDLDLTWTIRSEVLLITTPEEAEIMLVTKVYDVADLVTYRDEKGQIWEDYDTLVETITSTIEPTTWSENGGPGTIAAATFGTANVLAVLQTYQIHQQIAGLLEQLRAVARKNPGDGKPSLRKRPSEGIAQ